MTEQAILYEFGRLVRQNRKGRKISSKKLGAELNIHSRTILKVELGVRTHLHTRRRIARWLFSLNEELSIQEQKYASIL